MLRSLILAAALLATAAASAPPRPLLFGHRGASAYRPEHTLASYALAIDQGADYVEPDLVSSKDGVLVARHENEIGGTTDVAKHPEFAARRTTRTIDGGQITGWFTEDFTLAELKTLRAIERIPQLRPANAAYDGRFEIATLDEVIALVKRKQAETGRTIGLIPETKHPGYFASIGLPLEARLLKTLAAAGYRGADDPVIIQSFEVANLQAIARRSRIRLLQLVAPGGQPRDFAVAGDTRTYADLTTPAGLRFVRSYAAFIGPDKGMVIGRRPDGTLGAPARLVADAHAAGLKVTPYTFRPENYFLPADLQASGGPAGHGDAIGEMRAFLDAGIDGLFTDAPDLGRAAIDRVTPR